MIQTVLVPRLVVRLAGLLLCSLVLLGWSLPADAAPGKPQLEDQVLEIIRQHPEALIESVRAYEQKQQEKFQQAQQAFLQQMKANPQAFVGQSPIQGTPNANVVLIEFSDFQCPYCAEARKTIKQFVAAHPDQVTLTYKHFPILSAHPEALPAARAAWAAGQQGKFWQYHDALFSQQEKLGEPLYLATAKSLKLDLEQFNRDRSSDIATLSIDDDMNLAQRFGINGTPFLIMNGEIISGSLSVAALEDVLNRVGAEVASTGNRPPVNQNQNTNSQAPQPQAQPQAQSQAQSQANRPNQYQ